MTVNYVNLLRAGKYRRFKQFLNLWRLMTLVPGSSRVLGPLGLWVFKGPGSSKILGSLGSWVLKGPGPPRVLGPYFLVSPENLTFSINRKLISINWKWKWMNRIRYGRKNVVEKQKFELIWKMYISKWNQFACYENGK